MKCIKCGAMLDDNTEFCGNCGTKLAVKNQKGKKLVVILGLLLVAIIVGGCFLMLRKKQKSFPEVEATLSKYFDAVENYDYDTMVNLTVNDLAHNGHSQEQLIGWYHDFYDDSKSKGILETDEIYFLKENGIPSIYTEILSNDKQYYSFQIDFINRESKRLDFNVDYKIKQIYQPDEVLMKQTKKIGHGSHAKVEINTIDRKEFEEKAFDGKVEEWYIATIDFKWYVNGYLYGYDTELMDNILEEADEPFRVWLIDSNIISDDKEERDEKNNNKKDVLKHACSDYPVIIYKYEGEWYLSFCPIAASNCPSIWENLYGTSFSPIEFEVINENNKKTSVQGDSDAEIESFAEANDTYTEKLEITADEEYDSNTEEKATEEYSETDKVQSDILLVQTIKTAMEIATMDAAVANEPDYVPFEKGDGGLISELSRGGTTFMSSFNECCGVNNPSELNDKIMSTLGKEQGEIEYYWVSDSSVVVYINNTYRYGFLEKHKISRDDCKCIYAGPTELLPYDFVGSY